MTKLYFAAPTRFEHIDFNKIGTGQNVARNGHGIYMGKKHLALHYLDSYRNYSDADHTFVSRNGNVIGQDSVIGKRAIELQKEIISRGEHATPPLIKVHLEEEFDVTLSDAYYGAIYEADTDSLSICDSGSELQEQSYYDIIDSVLDKTKFGQAFTQGVGQIERFFHCDEKLEIEVNFSLDAKPSDLLSELINDLYVALAEAHEHDVIDMPNYSEFSEDNVKSFIYKTLACDFYSWNSFDNEIEDMLDEELKKKIAALALKDFTLEMKDATIKNTYSLMCDNLKCDDVDLAGVILKKVSGYDAYTCENNMSQIRSVECVIFNKRAAESIKIREVNREENYDCDNTIPLSY